jgi:phosphoglucosamine mutase
LRAVVESGRSLKDLASQVTRYPQVLVNVRVKTKAPLETLPKVTAEIQRLEKEMVGRGRLLVRYSGTENLARVMIEGEDQATITDQANFLADLIKSSLDK